MSKDSTCKDFLQVQTEGKRQISRSMTFYNLDIYSKTGLKGCGELNNPQYKADYKLTPESIDYIKKGESFKLFYRKNLLNVGGFENLL